MAIQTGLESLANLRATQASTASVEQSTFEKQQTFGTRKAAMELDLEKADYMFHELMANRPTRDALNAMNMTKSEQFTKALQDNPELIAAEMQYNVKKQELEVSDAALEQEYGIQYAFAQGITSALENNNPAEATRLTKQLNEEILGLTGKPLDLGLEGPDGQPINIADNNFQVTQDMLPMVRSLTNISKHMSEYGQKKQLEEIKAGPSTSYYDYLKEEAKSLGNIQKGQKITKEDREQAGAALSQLNENLFGDTVLGTADEILSSDNSTAQMEAVRDAIANIQKATGKTHGEIADIMNDNFTAAQDYDLPGIAWADEVDIILPSPGSQAAQMLQFSPEQFYAQVEEYAKMKDISRQAAADFASRQIIGLFSNMVTSQ